MILFIYFLFFILEIYYQFLLANILDFLSDFLNLISILP
jgi:hypothetical protein